MQTEPQREDVERRVIAAMEPYLGPRFGNASSIHQLGQQARQAVDAARQAVASLFGALPDEIYFAPSIEYANNVAILGRARFVEGQQLPRCFAAGPAEAPSISACLTALSQAGWNVQALELAGADWWQPLQDLQNKTCVHVDASLMPGFMRGRLGFHDLAIDSLCLSAATLYAPLSLSVLIVRRGINIMPVVFGGGQETGLFPGTEPVAHIAGIGEAACVWMDSRTAS